jgi:hypothetical protein
MLKYTLVFLSTVMVSVLVIGPKVRGFKPGRGDGFLRAIKIRRNVSSGGEVKPHIVRFYGMLKIPKEYDKRYYVC